MKSAELTKRLKDLKDAQNALYSQRCYEVSHYHLKLAKLLEEILNADYTITIIDQNGKSQAFASAEEGADPKETTEKAVNLLGLIQIGW